MCSNIPVRHHYIPQFLLRKLCNSDGVLYYCDKKSQNIVNKKPEEIFMVRNLYRDTINNPDNPVQIEKDFSVYEREASEIIQKFLNGSEVTISVEEEEKLKLFFALMGIRSKDVAEKFSSGLSEDSRKIYSVYQENGDFTDFWKRNLSLLVKCRSYSEIETNQDIDEPIKLFMRRDIIGYAKMHFVIAERRGKEEFIIGDSYPIDVCGLLNGNELREYSIYPISSDRMLFMVENSLVVLWQNSVLSDFEQELKSIPPRSKDGKTVKYHVKKMYENDVKLFNAIIFDGAVEGIAFRDKTKVSFSKYPEIYANWRSSGQI